MFRFLYHPYGILAKTKTFLLPILSPDGTFNAVRHLTLVNGAFHKSPSAVGTKHLGT
jgi:hypothetical protein